MDGTARNLPAPEPCVGVCELNNKGYCKGCLRSREERFNWLAMTPAQQQEVMRLCRNRKARVEAARRKAQAEGRPIRRPARLGFFKSHVAPPHIRLQGGPRGRLVMKKCFTP